VEQLRAPLTDRSRTFHVSDDNAVDDDDDAKIDSLEVVDTDVFHLSSGRSPLVFPDKQFVSLGPRLLLSRVSLPLQISPVVSAASLLRGIGTGIGSGSGKGIGTGYGTNIAVGGISPAGGHPAAPNARGIDVAAANVGGLTWAVGKPGGECGHRGLAKNPRGNGDGRVLGTGVDVGGIHGIFSPSGRLPPVTPDSDLIDLPAVVESLWTGVRDVVPLRYADCTASLVKLLPGLRDVANLSETLVLRTFCLVALNPSDSSPLRLPLDLRRRAVPLSSLSFHTDCRSTLTVWSSPGSGSLHSSGVISMRGSFASPEPVTLLNLSLPCRHRQTRYSNAH